MARWILNPDPDAADIIDHITFFRLSREDHHFGDDPDDVWWSVLVELQGISIDQFELFLQEFSDDLVIPAAYDATDRSMVRPLQPVALYARTRLVDHLNDRDNDLSIASVLLGASIPDRFLDRGAQPRDLPEVIVDEDAVIQAIICSAAAQRRPAFIMPAYSRPNRCRAAAPASDVI